jgi:hypothetical protein
MSAPKTKLEEAFEHGGLCSMQRLGKHGDNVGEGGSEASGVNIWLSTRLRHHADAMMCFWIPRVLRR